MEADKQKHAGGRPSTYSQELADIICERISFGESLRTVCSSEDMPAASSVFLWLRKYKEFSEQYALACEERTEAMLEDIQYASDQAIDDIMNEVVDVKASNALVSAYKLKTDNLKWAGYPICSFACRRCRQP